MRMGMMKTEMGVYGNGMFWAIWTVHIYMLTSLQGNGEHIGVFYRVLGFGISIN